MLYTQPNDQRWFKLCADWGINEGFNERVAPWKVSDLLVWHYYGILSYDSTKKVYAEITKHCTKTLGTDRGSYLFDETLYDIVDRLDLWELPSNEIEYEILKVINDNPEQVQQYRDGKEQVVNFLMGQVMKATKGKLKPNEAIQMIKDNI